jgi:hypothetical protein
MKFSNVKSLMTFGSALMLITSVASAGVLDPDCNVEKAARSAAMKATVGVGGRCKPGETTKDMSRDALGIDKKSPIEKRHKENQGLGKKAANKIKN